jgi:hypothetical protein
MSRIRLAARLLTPSSLKALQKEDTKVMYGLASGAPVQPRGGELTVNLKKRQTYEEDEPESDTKKGNVADEVVSHAETGDVESGEQTTCSEKEIALEEETDLRHTKDSYIEMGKSIVSHEKMKILKNLDM